MNTAFLIAASVSFVLAVALFVRKKPAFAALAGFLSVTLLGTGYAYTMRVAPNPDPNHTHADFAVWIKGQQMDFTADKYMSGSSTDESTHPTEGPRKYLHLHDGNGSVIHRHKPGLTFGDFLASVSLAAANGGEGPCLYTMSANKPFAGCESGKLRLFVNGIEKTVTYPGDIGYLFEDTDQILLTDSTEAADVQKQLQILSDDACLYSRTCPGRGDPPSENCIADPTVPCVAE